MASGIPLNDADREDWLNAINKHAKDELTYGSCVIACSALKESYRQALSKGLEQFVNWIFLKGKFDIIYSRLKCRDEHFMPPTLLKSQFDILETPNKAIVINIDNLPETIVQIIKEKLFIPFEFGIIGLGVMGKNIARNMATKGVRLAIYNRHAPPDEEKVADRIKKSYKELRTSGAFDHLLTFVKAIKGPKKILLMIKAGESIDKMLSKLTPLLSAGDLLIDAGNSHFKDTESRQKKLFQKGVYLIGCGVSGGEFGALHGPSIMAGGHKKGYSMIKSILEMIASEDDQHKPCCSYLGPGGSGHYVKMVHNGIEYAEMQLLAEVYHLYKNMGKPNNSIAEILNKWQETSNSYLLEITISILKKQEDGSDLLEKILDKAENKGTGNWAAISSAELGIPSTMISSALFARYISSFKKERNALSNTFPKNQSGFLLDDDTILNAYTFARIINHHQAFILLKYASKAFNYKLNLSEIARVWTKGCIIRSDLMNQLISPLKLEASLLNNKNINNILTDNYESLFKLLIEALTNKIAIPCFNEAINYFNAITTKDLPANLIQAQRDFFGAHGYQRNDKPSKNHYHTNWIKSSL
jgi:6-phosphogluconate dehydrogenase